MPDLAAWWVEPIEAGHVRDHRHRAERPHIRQGGEVDRNADRAGSRNLSKRLVVRSLIAQSMMPPSDRLDRPRGTVDAVALAMPVALVAIGYAIALALTDRPPYVTPLLPLVNTIAFSGAVVYCLLKVRARANDDDRLQRIARGDAS